jgi:hypothetical protein
MFEAPLDKFKFFYLFCCWGHLSAVLEFNFLQKNLGAFGRVDFFDILRYMEVKAFCHVYFMIYNQKNKNYLIHFLKSSFLYLILRKY